MSTVFRFGTGPGDKERVFADSGFESVGLGGIDDDGRLVLYDDAMCSSVAVSPDELEQLAAFVRRHGKQQTVDDVQSSGFDGSTLRLSTMDKVILHADVDSLISPCKALLLFLNDDDPHSTAKSAEYIRTAFNRLRPTLRKLIARGRKFGRRKEGA